MKRILIQKQLGLDVFILFFLFFLCELILEIGLEKGFMYEYEMTFEMCIFRVWSSSAAEGMLKSNY